MCVIRPDWSELSTLKLEKLIYLTLYHSIYKYKPIDFKLSQNLYIHEILDEFDDVSVGPKQHELFAFQLEVLY